MIKRTRGEKIFAVFNVILLSLIGLAWNELLMWLFRMIFGEDQILFTVFGFRFSMYMMNACLTTLLVMVWNFFTKKAILQSRLLQKWLKK